MTFVEKPDDEVRAMSHDEFMKYLALAVAEDRKPGGAYDQKRAYNLAHPPKPPTGPVEAIVSFIPKYPKNPEG